MISLREDPQACEAVLDALAAVGAARTGYAGPGPDAADPELSAWAGEVAGIEVDEDGGEAARLTRFALAMLGGVFLDEVERLGGDPGALMARIALTVTRTGPENRR